MTAMTVRPFRSAADTRHRPAARVKPVLTPIAPSYIDSRRLWLTRVRPAAVQVFVETMSRNTGSRRAAAVISASSRAVV